MEPVKVLFVCSEITPYLPATEISAIGRQLPQGIQDEGREIRTFMPRYGNINERRNQLHEVIRLSGMNQIIDDTDHPLLIKVASISAARMQIYFIDNEDYFQRKHTFSDEHHHFYKDNDERMIFFTRGVIETVRKLRWSPDIVHCHGWFTYLTALYLKKAYKDDPLFANSKIVLSVYNDGFTETLDPNFKKKALFNGVKPKDVELLAEPTYENLVKMSLKYSDGAIVGSPEINAGVEVAIKDSKKPFLPYQPEDQYIKAYSDFYDVVLGKR